MYYTVELEIEAGTWVTLGHSKTLEIAQGICDLYPNDAWRIIKHEVILASGEAHIDDRN
jgi:hypothetical protein